MAGRGPDDGGGGVPHKDAAAEVVDGALAGNFSGPLVQMLTGAWAAAVETAQHNAAIGAMIERRGFIREATFCRNPFGVPECLSSRASAQSKDAISARNDRILTQTWNS